MKYNYVHSRLAIIACIVLLFAGCKDFLDLKPKGRDIPETVEHYNGMFNSTTLTSVTYSQAAEGGMTKLGVSTLYNMFMSDELTATLSSSTHFDFKINQAYAWKGKVFDEEDNTCEWSALYQQIYTFNVIISDVPDATGGTDKRKRELQAEARVNRAFRYLLLAQYFGKPYGETATTDLCVPIVKEADMNLKDLKRNTVKEVYDFVIKELEESCPELVESTNHHLRIYQCAGWFFLGKAYWLKGDYENARFALEKALEASKINSTGLRLWDYNQMMSQWGYDPKKPYDWKNGFPSNVAGDNKEIIYNYQYSISKLTQTPSKLFVKDNYMELYEDGDLRRRFFTDKDQKGIPAEGWRRLGCRSLFSLGADMPDLYLMLIECQVRSAEPSVQQEGRANLEYFRRHRMPSDVAIIPVDIDSQEKLIRFVVEERLREYMMTGMRWFDMRRLWNDPLFQDLKAEYTHTDGGNNYTLTEERLVYQIPPKVLVYHDNWENNK